MITIGLITKISTYLLSESHVLHAEAHKMAGKSVAANANNAMGIFFQCITV